MSDSIEELVLAQARCLGVTIDRNPWRTLWERSPLTSEEWGKISVWLDEYAETGAVGGAWPAGITLREVVSRPVTDALRRMAEELF